MDSRGGICTGPGRDGHRHARQSLHTWRSGAVRGASPGKVTSRAALLLPLAALAFASAGGGAGCTGSHQRAGGAGIQRGLPRQCGIVRGRPRRRHRRTLVVVSIAKTCPLLAAARRCRASSPATWSSCSGRERRAPSAASSCSRCRTGHERAAARRHLQGAGPRAHQPWRRRRLPRRSGARRAFRRARRCS